MESGAHPQAGMKWRARTLKEEVFLLIVGNIGHIS